MITMIDVDLAKAHSVVSRWHVDWKLLGGRKPLWKHLDACKRHLCVLDVGKLAGPKQPRAQHDYADLAGTQPRAKKREHGDGRARIWPHHHQELLAFVDD